MLLAAPVPGPDEAPSSWIQYVCASHQYSMTRLEKVLGVKPRFHDWDLRVKRQDWIEILQRANCKPETFSRAFLSSEFSKLTSSGMSSSVLFSGPPKFRWCSACLIEDERPYLRWWWRLQNSTHCPKHHNRLSRRCSNCQSELVLSHALMVNAGKCFPIPDLSHCSICGFKLWFAGPMQSSDPEASINGSLLAQSALSDETCDSILEIEKEIKKPSSVAWGKQRFLVDEWSLAVGPGRAGIHLSLLINGEVFKSQKKAESLNKSKWSSRIARWRVPIRQKLAYSLRLIRSEVNALNEESRQAAAKIEGKK